MTHDDAQDQTRPTPQGSSPYDRPDPWAKPPTGSPAGSSMPPPQPYGSPAAPDANPYGQPPPGQSYAQPPADQPPYGQQYGAPQYGAPPYGQQYGAQPYGQAPSPEMVKLRSSATLWLILNIVAVLFWGWFAGGLLSIVGAIFAGIALGEVTADPASARRKVRLAKILFWVGLVISVLIVVGGVIFLVVFANSFDSSTFEPVPSTGV